MPPPQTAHAGVAQDDEEDTADDATVDDGEWEDDGSDAAAAVLSKPLAIFLGKLSKLRQSGLLTAVRFSISRGDRQPCN